VIKRWLQLHRQSAVLVGLTLMLPLYVFLSALGSLWTARVEIVDQIDAIEPRVARLQGLIEYESAMQEALGTVAGGVRESVYPAESDASTVAANLQAEARRLFSEAGMDVANSQVLPVRQRDRFDYVAVKLVAKGSLEQLQVSLAELAAFRPVVLVETLDTSPARMRRDNPDAQELTVSVQLLALRVAS